VFNNISCKQNKQQKKFLKNLKMSTSNYYTNPDDNMYDDHVYEMVNNIEMNRFNVGQDRNSSNHTNAVYARAPILTRQSNDYDYAHRENSNVSM
jgi:hypothetical protein